MVCMTWLVMFLSGVPIGMMRITTLTHQSTTLRGRGMVQDECCGAVLGTLLPTTCGWLIASTSIRLVGSTPSDFDVCQDRISYP